jgi:hypothetical protein
MPVGPHEQMEVPWQEQLGGYYPYGSEFEFRRFRRS